MDRKAFARHPQQLFEGSDAPDATGGCAQLVPQQHHRRYALRQYRQDVVEEAGCLTLQTAYTIELCFGHGWCLYPYRYTTEPHH